ncbi:MAG: hypothetical protein WDM86_04355 [Rhizomicrobium sp.]
MRLRCVLALALLLAGCTHTDWSRTGTGALGSSSDADPAAMPATNVSSRIDRDCRETAKARASDAELQGFDPAIQQSVLDKTYADCLSWSRRTQ